MVFFPSDTKKSDSVFKQASFSRCFDLYLIDHHVENLYGIAQKHGVTLSASGTSWFWYHSFTATASSWYDCMHPVLKAVSWQEWLLIIRCIEQLITVASSVWAFKAMSLLRVFEKRGCSIIIVLLLSCQALRVINWIFQNFYFSLKLLKLLCNSMRF